MMEQDFTSLKQNLKDLYDKFFEDMGIDPQTGIVANTNKRFTGYPFIGSNYVHAPVKVLFIPLDCGEDECRSQNTYHSFEDRESIFIGGLSSFIGTINDHIAGLYAEALFLLKDKMNWGASWETLWAERDLITKSAMKKVSDQLPQDIMSYVAYENRYRFVTLGREDRLGGLDRRWIQEERESQMLVDEIDILNPDIIVFQGKDGIGSCRVGELKKKYKVFVTTHPSCWQRRANRLQYIVDALSVQ